MLLFSSFDNKNSSAGSLPSLFLPPKTKKGEAAASPKRASHQS